MLVLKLLSLWLAPRLFPKVTPRSAGPRAPAGLLVRMAAGAALKVAVSAGAARIGGTWSALFVLFPVLGSVLAVFSHRSHGGGFVAALLQGLTRGLYSLVAFGAATLACAGVQLLTRRRASPPGRS